MAPLLAILVTIAAFAYGPEAARGQLVWDIQGLVGPDRALALQALLQNADRPGTGVIAGLLSLVTLLRTPDPQTGYGQRRQMAWYRRRGHD